MTRYSVSGTLTPDATIADTGEPAGTVNGQPYWQYQAGGETWRLFYSALAVKWLICADWNGDGAIDERDSKDGPHWTSAALAGDYIPVGGATGTATVAEYVPPADEYIVVKWRASGEFTVLKKRQ
jgi:hypothetical protein